MNRIFLRIFPLIMLAIAIAAIAIYFAILYLFGNPIEDIARKQASGPIFLLEHYVDQAPSNDWLARLNKVREISHLDIELLPLASASQAMNGLDKDQRAALDRGDIVLDIPGKSFLRRVDLAGDRYIGSAEEVIHVRKLPIDVGLELKIEGTRYLIVLLCLLVPVAIWSRLHWKELQQLSAVANRLGEGNLSVRAHTKETSSIHPLAQCMNRMAERIEGLLSAQKSLLHSVSHELRTPISRLEFGLALMKRAEKKADIEARVRSMEEDLQELDELVEELLNLTRLEQRESLQRLEFDLDDALRETVAKLDHVFSSTTLRLDIAANLGVMIGDRRLIQRAVGNLLANAAKYGKEQVILSAKRSDNGSLHVSVEDDGPGIPEEAREKVFEAFYRLDSSRERGTGGFGLGLAIARKAIVLHHGSISVEQSAVLGGAAFVVRMPG
ncbi:MAG: two-component sensor histidine kinase [Paucimonas sp.]|nr:two-component sensor histidine kinase [Paucimonas sp.]